MIAQALPGTILEFLTDRQFMGNTPLQWLGLLGVLLVSFVVGKVLSVVFERQGSKLQRRNMHLLGGTLRSLSGPVSMLTLAGGLYVASLFLDLRPEEGTSLEDFWLNACRTIAVLAVSWFIFKIVGIVEYYLKRWTSKTKTPLDDQLVPLLRKSLRVFVVIVAFLFIAQNIFRWDIGALLAGLGVGGLAFALAARDMLANLFGSITIFADRPFAIGERIQVGPHDGWVEEVGFRSTRLRTLQGHLVTIPNATIANEMIENIDRRPYIKRVFDVTITYDTPPEKVRRAVEILREMLEARKDSFPPDLPGRAYFNEFNAASLNIVVYYYFTPTDWWEYLAFCDDFNMELLRRYNEEGIEFAFPTQTLYVKQDSPLAANLRMESDPSRSEGNS